MFITIPETVTVKFASGVVGFWQENIPAIRIINMAEKNLFVVFITHLNGYNNLKIVFVSTSIIEETKTMTWNTLYYFLFISLVVIVPIRRHYAGGVPQ